MWDQPAIASLGPDKVTVPTECWRYKRPPNGEELYDHDNDPTEWMNLSAMAEHTDTKEHLGGVLPESPSRRKIPRLPDLPPSARPMLEIPAGRFAKSDAPNYVELKAAHK